MDEYVWILPKNARSDVPIGAQILAKFGPRIKVKDDNQNEFWITSEEILRPMHPTSIFGVEDMISLEELQECSILRNLQIRYIKDLIYTYIGSILVAVNPYKNLPIYDQNIMSRYRRKRLGEMPPHIFAVADHSYESMRKMSEKRCIVISGESGAGKTESTKLFLRYFAAISNKMSGKEKKVLDSNPILEAFGNAKTVCNDNSSRFGKYITITFNSDGSIQSAQIKQYLLEKSRIVSQNQGEQNYHIFYSLLSGLTDDEKSRLNLKETSAYNYLNRTFGKTEEVDQIYNIADVKSAMKVLNFSDSEIWQIFEIIAAILHFGNIEFKPVSVQNSEAVSSVINEVTKTISYLLQVPEQFLVDSLTQKTISTHGDVVARLFSKQEAINSRDAFVKKIFGYLFNFIVEKINSGLSSSGKISNWKIGILDIFGFEAFDRNSFEQLCINYANEKLQQFFIAHVFKTEQEQYQMEGIDWKFVKYPDNTEILYLIESGPNSILSVINDATKIPKGSDQSMLDKLIEFHSENPFFFKPKYTNTPVFGIQHYAGVVLYDTKDFVEKNYDSCSLDMKKLVETSKNNFFKKIFSTEFESDSTSYYKKRMETLSSKFKNSLDLLMNELNECQPFFVRCIKPNEMKKPQKFDRILCCKQLRYSGMTEVTRLREAGYAVRYDFVQFVRHYRILVPGIPLAHKTSCKNATLRICQVVFKNFPSPDYRLGETKIFLKHAEDLYLEKQREKVLYNYAVVIQKMIRGWLARRRFFKLKKAVATTENCWKARRLQLQGNKIRRGFHRLISKIKSRQLVFEFQRYRKLIIRLEACIRGYLVRNSVKKKLQLNHTRNRIKELENPNESADFKEFARQYFQEKQTHYFSKKPIKTSLTQLVQVEQKIAAKAIWLTILRFTDNVSEKQNIVPKMFSWAQLREIIRTINTSDQGNTEREEYTGKVTRLYEEWIKTPTTHLQKLCFIISHGIKVPELRDEIYCQICKVLTKNPSKKATHRGWELLSSCTGCFPPSDLFLKYLKSFVRKGDTKSTSFCLFRLHRTIQNGNRNQPPFSTEFEAIKRQKPVNLEVFLMNGEISCVKIDSATTANELLDLVAKNINLKDVFGFSLVLSQDLRQMPLDGSTFVLDAISEYEQYAMEVAGSFEKMHWKLILKREMFAPWHDFSYDGVARNLTYHQIKEGIKFGEYGFDDTDLPSLIARIYYIEREDLQYPSLDEAISHFTPQNLQEDGFIEQVKDSYQKIFDKNERSVESVRTEIIKHAANNWTVQFSRFYRVIGSIKNLKSTNQYPEVPLMVGVNMLGVFIIDETNEKRVVAKMNFVEIREVSRKEVAEGREYILTITSYEDTEVSLNFRSAFDNDLHKLLIKILETLKKYSKFVICHKNYESQDKSFLELKKGDLIELSNKFYGRDLLRNSWAEGYNNRTGKIGNFSIEFVEIIPTTEKPPEFIVKAIADERLYEKRTPVYQNTEKLKHYTLKSYADKYFRTNEFKVGGRTTELWKYSTENIQKPLHANLASKEKEAKVAVQIFDAILRYTESKRGIHTEEDLVLKIFSPGLENAQLRDETYCQIIKQLTSNSNKTSENETWELMWMITGLFPCGDILASHVKKFLQSRRTIHNARECLSRFNTALKSEPRKYPPHFIEIEGIQHMPCHIFHRVYFPDDTHKFFQVSSFTKINELKESILNRLGINLPKKEFCLFVQILERLFLLPEDFYVFDYLQILKRWMDKNKLQKKWEYKILFMKYTWKNSMPGYDKITDLKFVFPQEYTKYIQGYYELPNEEIVQMAGLLYNVFSSNETSKQFQKILQKIIPSKVVNQMKTDTWEKEIQRSSNNHISLSTEDCKIMFLQKLHKVSSHHLPFFTALPYNSNLTNYIFYPVTLNT